MLRPSRVATPAPDVVDVLEELRAFRLEVLEQFQSLRQLLERNRGPRDAADITLLFMVIAEVIGDRPFSAAGIMAHQQASAVLRDALEASDVTTARELGALCRRVERMPISELRLERVGTCRDGVQWRLRVHESHTRAD